MGGYAVGADENLDGVVAVNDRGLLADVLEGYRIEVFALAKHDVVGALHLGTDRFFE